MIFGNNSDNESSESPRASIALDNLPITGGERGVGRMVPDSTVVGCNLSALVPFVNPHAHHPCQTICVEKSCRPASLPRGKLLKCRSCWNLLTRALSTIMRGLSNERYGFLARVRKSQAAVSAISRHRPSESSLERCTAAD